MALAAAMVAPAMNTAAYGWSRWPRPRLAPAVPLMPLPCPAEGSSGVNLISVVTAKGALRFAAYDGNLNAPTFIDFCRRLLHDTPGPVLLVLDGHPVHRSNGVLAGAEPRRVGVEEHQARPDRPRRCQRRGRPQSQRRWRRCTSCKSSRIWSRASSGTQTFVTSPPEQSTYLHPPW
jgi:hypothetical protein